MLPLAAQQTIGVGTNSACTVVKKYYALRQKATGSADLIRGADVPVIPQNRKFRAPLKTQDPLFTRITVAASVSMAVELPGGYVVKIEKGDLVDSRGREVSGNYTLYFRDISSPWNMALSGVPMNYDSGGTIGYFQSSGMFELYAEQNGEALQVKRGQTIDIVLPSPDGSDDYNFYTFNESSGAWEFEKKLFPGLSTMKTPDSIQVYSEAYRYLQLLSLSTDFMSFHERWLSPKYARTKNITETDFFCLEKQYYGRIGVAYFRLQRTSDKYNRKAILFKFPVVSRNKYSGNIFSTFPELNAVRNVVWEYKGPIDRKSFSKLFVSKKKYFDTRIDYDNSSGLFTIYLKHKDGVIELNAIPYRGKNTYGERALKANVLLAERYNKSLARVQRKFDRRNHDAALVLLNENKERVKSMMSEEELAMGWTEWERYARRVQNYYNTIAMQGRVVQITRTVSVSGLGLVNCDRIQRMQEPVELLAQFVLPDGKIVDTAHVMVIGSDYTCLNMDVKHGKVRPVIERRIATAFGVVINDEDFYIVDASQVAKSLNRSGLQVFSLKKVEGDAAEAISLALSI
ncbi:MAG: hypothetical protein CVU11_07990 [Bacteroidetes bacterium HGW-Bacteroidetes-6]|nr:MAG: hypothetical protein CVU11_07990 [Bacteroidetes bacterium HGW-Bacteroidetes-6]